MATNLPTAVATWGFCGSAVENGCNPARAWATARDVLTTVFDLLFDEARRHFEARFGRHLADKFSFVKGGTGAQNAIEEDLMFRLADREWRKCFITAIRDMHGERTSS